MSKIISVHSFRGGTGKSNITANIASVCALAGLRVGVVDTDIASPGIHVLFNYKEEQFSHSLNDYLWGKCSITDCAQDVTNHLGREILGKVFLVPSNIDAGKVLGKVYLIPSSIEPGEIAHILKDGYDVGLLNDGFESLNEMLKLDVLLIDTHPGLNEETLLSIAISDALAIVMRPDQQDYQGTSVVVEVARKLEVPRILIIVNKTPASFDATEVQTRVEHTYNCPVAAVIPHSEEIMTLASSGIFVTHYPDHPVTELYKQIAAQLIA